jgi:hypothetical protein
MANAKQRALAAMSELARTKECPNSKYLAIAFRPPLVAASFISSFDVCSRASSTLRPTDLAGITVAKWLCGV